jgi:predicted nuclease of predicted toxin-antitoxin system
MKLKLDENFDVRIAPMFTDQGHDVDTVLAEGLAGGTDEQIYAECRKAARTLVTLDLDFSNPFRFPPGPTQGIVVVRPPRPVLSAIRATMLSVLPELQTRSLAGKTWIVEPGRIRVYDPHDETAEP